MIKKYNYIEYNNIISKYLKKNDDELINSLAILCPINKNFFLSNKKFFLNTEKFFFLKIFFLIFKLFLKFFILIISKRKINLKAKKKILFLSHSNSKNEKKIKDVYFYRIIKHYKIPSSKYLIKFYPQSNKFVINNSNFFNGNNLTFVDEIKIIKKILQQVLIELLKKFFILDNFSKKIVIDLLSGNTYKNIRIALEIKNFIKLNNIKKLFITYEGHSYEKLLCYFIKKYLPNTKIYGYQTTCMSKNQSFLVRPKDKFLPHKILLSRKTDLNFFNIYNRSIFKPIYLGKLKKNKKNINHWKLSKKTKILKILILIDRYCEKDLNQIITFSKKLSYNKNYKIIFRAHPLFKRYFLNKFNKDKLNMYRNFYLNHSSSIKDLFLKNDVIIYSQSSFFIESFRFAIFPIYFNYSSENYEDIFSNIKKPILNSSKKFDYLIKNFKKINKIYKFNNYLFSEKNFVFNEDKLLKKIFS